MADFSPRMPDVEEVPDLEERFSHARVAAADPQQRRIAIVSPQRLTMFQDCPPKGTASPAMVAAIHQIVRTWDPLNIAVIGMTDVDAVMEDWSQAIPIAGFLLGMGYLGHRVVVFEGHPSSIAAGCRDADLLLVDGAMEPFLPENWVELARSTMRGRQRIVVTARDGTAKEIVGGG